MGSQMIIYDLHKPEQDYAELIDAIKAYPDRWHCFDSTWIVKTTQSSAQVRDALKVYIDSNDELIVFEVTASGWAAWGISKQCSDWLLAKLRT